MNSFIYNSGVQRVASVQTFAQYKEAESYNQAQRAVNNQGDLLDYETLELRVHPPNVEVKLEGNETLITVDSANRPGTLIEVVQCLTELGLSFTRARITSDGGWFVDEFVVHDSNGPVKDTKKLAAIQKVLNVNFESDEAQLAARGVDGGACTVVEIIGQDRHGLLAKVVDVLHSNGLAVWSAAVWTYRGRAAFVLGVGEAGKPLQEPAKRHALSRRFYEMLGGATHRAHVKFTDVHHHALVHHDRRLHTLMLEDEVRQYEKEYSEAKAAQGAANGHFQYSVIAELGLHDAAGGYAKPFVVVQYSSSRKYWFVTVRCADRDKLLFDTVCTFVDLDFDVFHATLDSEAGADGVKVHQEYYVRPRLGGSDWDPEKAERLKWMLTAAILRRLPKGLKLHVQTHEKVDLSQFLATIQNTGLTITRAKVKPSRAGGGRAEHTFYVLDAHGNQPDVAAVEAAICAVGGNLLKAGSTPPAARATTLGGHKFSFSCVERNWSAVRKDWGVGSTYSGCSLDSGTSDPDIH